MKKKLKIIAVSKVSGTKYIYAKEANGGFVRVSTEKSYPQTWLVYKEFIKYL